jgi:hypothetical protein
MELKKNKNGKKKNVNLIKNKKTPFFIKKKEIKYPKYFLQIKIIFLFFLSIIVKFIAYIIR